MHPSRSRPIGAVALLFTGLLALAVALPATAAEPSPGPSPTPGTSSPAPDEEHATWCDAPGPAHASYCDLLDPELDDAGWCELHGIEAARCYHAGTARLVLRGGAKRTLTIPLRIGERRDPDLGGELWFQYGGHGDANLVLAVPATPGTATATTEGGAPAMDWAVSGVGSGSAAGCTIEMTADPVGVVTGTVRCSDLRTGAGKRLRLTVSYRAVPLVAGPLPSPTPPATLPPTASPVPVCGLLDGDAVEAAIGVESGSLLLLPAGAGQCVGLAAELEVAALFVAQEVDGSPLGDGTTWRGARCDPLPLTQPDLAPTGAACAWPDGRRFVVAAGPDAGSAALVLSLALPASAGPDDPAPKASIDALIALLREAIARRP